MVRTRGASTVSGRRSTLPRNSGETVNMERMRDEPIIDHNSGESVDRTTPNTTQAESLSRKKRGPTLGIMKPKTGQEKMFVNIIGQNFLEPEARSKTRILFQKRFKEARTKFEQWPKHEIELLWGEYLKYFRFASSEEEGKGRIIWEENARKSYPNYLWRWKDDAMKKFGSIQEARDKKPSWTTLDVWQEMCDYWLSKDFLDSSELRKKNRNITTYVPHTSGSIPYAVRREQEKQRLHRPPTQYELYKQTHMRKEKGSEEKTWVYDEAKRKLDDYERRLLAKHGDTDKPVNELDDPNLETWQETVGGVKKGRLVGRPGEKWSSRRGLYCPSFVADENSIKLKKMESYITYLHQYAKNMAETLALDPPIDPDDLFASSNASVDIPTNNSTTHAENDNTDDDDSQEDSMENSG